MSFDFVFVSMPYARFISRWFSNVPNINLGIMQSFLKKKGKMVKTFHFHLEFLPFINRYSPTVWRNFLEKSEEFGVEIMSIDYVFASLLFEENYKDSIEKFEERLNSIGITLSEFEKMRDIAKQFIDYAFYRLLPYLDSLKLIGFSCSHYQLSSSLLLCKKVKDYNPDIVSIFGGKDCSGSFSSELIKYFDYCDYVGVNECELTIERLLEHLEDSKMPLYNVLYRGDGGKILLSALERNISLDSLPEPEYDFDDLPIKMKEIILPVEFGRGCPWRKCTFCPDESYKIYYQVKSAEKIKSEFNYYLNISPDLKNFFILDSDALKNPQIIIDVANYIEDKGLTFHYAEFRAERMNRDVLRALLRFGKWASHFQIGIETFSDRVLKLMNKGVTVLKNVEVLKAVAELNVPVQFNLFTCYPRMNINDMYENNRIMEIIKHILICDCIQIFPGEFYLPTDCPIFLDIKRFGIEKHTCSIFADIFNNFPMPSYSNYPYPYQFNNEEEQLFISEKIRQEVDSIKKSDKNQNYMFYEVDKAGNLKILVNRDGNKREYIYDSLKKDVYLIALEEIQSIDKVSDLLKVNRDKIMSVIQEFESNGLVLYSNEEDSYLSLAMPINKF